MVDRERANWQMGRQGKAGKESRVEVQVPVTCHFFFLWPGLNVLSPSSQGTCSVCK